MKFTSHAKLYGAVRRKGLHQGHSRLALHFFFFLVLSNSVLADIPSDPVSAPTSNAADSSAQDASHTTPPSVQKLNAAQATINDTVSGLTQQKFTPPAPKVYGPVPLSNPASQTSQATRGETPRSLLQAEDDVAIKNNVFTLFNEKLPGTQAAVPLGTAAPRGSAAPVLSAQGQASTKPAQTPLPVTSAPSLAFDTTDRTPSTRSASASLAPEAPAAADQKKLASTQAPTAPLASAVAVSPLGVPVSAQALNGAAVTTQNSALPAPVAASQASYVFTPGAPPASPPDSTSSATRAAQVVPPLPSVPVPTPVAGPSDNGLPVAANGPNSPSTPPQTAAILAPLPPAPLTPALSQAVLQPQVQPAFQYTSGTNTAAGSLLALNGTTDPTPKTTTVTSTGAGATTLPQTATTAVSPHPTSLTDDPKGSADQSDAHFIRRLSESDDALKLNVSAEAEAPSIDGPIGIDEAVAFALRNNFEVQASGEKVNGAYWDKMGAYAEYIPSVEFDYDTGSEKSEPASINDEFGNRVLSNTHHRYDKNLSVRQPLIDLGIISDILSFEDKKDVATYDNRDVREGIASDTVNVYLKLLQARIAVGLADQYKTYLDDLAVRMEARVEGGGAASSDLDRIRGRSTLASSARIEALGEYQTSIAEFKRLTKVMPSQIKIPNVLAPSVPANIQEVFVKAVQANPAYLSSLSKIDAATDDRNKSLSGLLPKLSLQYTNSFSYDAGGAAEGNPVDGVYPDQKTQTVMLVAQWALNGGTAVTSGLAGAAKEREMSLRSQDVKARVEQGIRSSYTAITAAKQRRDALVKAVEADERVVKGFEDQYKTGGRSLFDLLDAYEQLYNARLNLMRVLIANAQASYQVRREMGELVASIIGEEKE